MTIKQLIYGGLLCLVTSAVQGQVIVTDTTWKATDQDPPSGWNTSLAFDDSSWGDAVVVRNWTVDGDQVDALWFNGDAGSGPLNVWFRKVFTVAAPSSGSLSIGVDDDAQVFLNGTLVVDDHNGVAGNTEDVPVSLTAGQNLLAVQATDTGGLHSFALRLRVGCPTSPLPGCTTNATGKGSLSLAKKAGDASKSKLGWKWTHGASTMPLDFGDPTVSTSYEICVYDGAGVLQMDLLAPAAGTCDNGKPCWKATGKGATAGFKYKRKDGVPGGITGIALKAGAADKAKVSVKGKGSALAVPTLPLDQSAPVQVQLLNSSTAVCWGASYSAPPLSKPGNTDKWKDKND